MRFQIRTRLSLTTPFQFVLPQATIDVRYSKGGFEWLWCDNGTVFGIEFPKTDVVRNMRWYIFADEQEVCWGRMVNPAFRDAMLKAALPHKEWRIGEQVIFDELWYCCGVIRTADRRRLALWRLGWPTEGVLRDRIPQHLTPILLAMVLTNIYSD